MWNRFTPHQRAMVLVSLLAVVLISGGSYLRIKRTNQTILKDVFIDNVNVGGKSVADAAIILSDGTDSKANQLVRMYVDNIEVASTAAELGGHREFTNALTSAYQVGRSGSLMNRIKRWITPTPIHFNSSYTFDSEKVTEFIAVLEKKVNVDGQSATATLAVSNSPASLKIFAGKSGRLVEEKTTEELLFSQADQLPLVVQAQVASTSSPLNEAQIAAASERARKLVGKQVTLRAENVYHALNDQDLVKILQFPEGINTQSLSGILSEVAKKTNRAPENAELKYDPATLKVSTFNPSRDGLQLDEKTLEKQLTETLQQFETGTETSIELTLPVSVAKPTVQLGDTNNLGIQERVGFGESEYEHSIPNRIHNVALTASRVNNVIVAPGQEFSFNKALGDVSAATGFKSAYVIRNGKTELGDGGGVCQVSTTLFRALLNAGIPVTKRRAHSYRVSYYELNAKPGIDATVYAGDVDLRFLNDTGHHLLIHTQTDSQNLYMVVEIFGTSDGRTAQIIDHKTWGFAAAPPPLYVDDPTLPAGKLKQIDFAASGINASFVNVVKNAQGEIIRQDEYVSKYKPWQAVYLRGTGP